MVRTATNQALCHRGFRLCLGSKAAGVCQPGQYGVEPGRSSEERLTRIISGMAAAMGMGENTRKYVITRSLARDETAFAVHMGPTR